MEKLSFVSLIIFAALAIVAGSPRDDQPSSSIKRSSSAFSRLLSSQRRRFPRQSAGEQICDRMSWNDGTHLSGTRLRSGSVTVCTERSLSSGLCYFTPLRKCCSNSGLESSLVSSTLKVGSKNVSARIVVVNRNDFCVSFDRINIEHCPRSGRCFEQSCTQPLQLCMSNSVSCDHSTCICKEGYKKPSCCECKENYIEHNGVCQFQCKTNCLDIQHCTACAHPYADPPLCCDCFPPYVKKDGICQCPDGAIEIDGICKSICQENTVACDSPLCCKEGFKAPLCCD